MTDTPFTIDDSLIRKLAGLLDETKLTEIEYAWGEHRLRVTRQPAPVQAAFAAPSTGGLTAASVAASLSAAPIEDDLSKHPGAVKSPMVGTVYLSPQPNAPPFIKVGDQIAAGQPLLIIEAMKVMNQIRAPKAGRVARILVSDSSPVEFDQVVIVVE